MSCINMSRVPDFVWDLTNLEYLNLSNNRITQISPNIINLRKLIELNLLGNPITEIPGKIKYCKNLKIYISL
jgi:Leucine-rich repeat (LRR) protein